MLETPLHADDWNAIVAGVSEDLGQLVGDPEGYIEWAFPWRQKGTSLEHADLRAWQRGFARELGQEIRDRGFDGINPVDPIQISTVSGHGIGKSALTAMTVKFIHDTCPDSRGVVTANTSTQLRIRTWAELGKWHRMSQTQFLSEYYASRGNMALINHESPETWRVDAFTSTKENSEAFQGQHSVTSSPFYIFDEASAIPREIYEAAAGGMTDGMPVWLLFGNGTRNSGEFFDSHNHGKKRRLWRRHSINSMDVENANVKLFQRWIDTYGWDSDFVRVRVRGLFPNASSLQFIETDVVDWCMQELSIGFDHYDPLIYGVDVARFGDDDSVICRRRGRHVYPFEHRFNGIDTVAFASKIADLAQREQPDAIFVDGDGIGGGVIDILRSLNVRNVMEVHGAAKATGRECANMRAQSYYNLREALRLGVDLPDEEDLKSDLTGLEFGYRITDNRILLERKDDMKKRLGRSPDVGDSLALTYALPVGLRDESNRGIIDGRSGPEGRPANLVTDH